MNTYAALLSRATTLAAIVGCSSPIATSAGSTSGDAPDAAPAPVCSPHSKLCSGVCVSEYDPATGCALDTCDPCQSVNATSTCTVGGACAPASCLPGWSDCDGSGCNVHTSADPLNCGHCGTTCQPGQTCGMGMCDGMAACGCVDAKGACQIGDSATACGVSGNPCEDCASLPSECAIHFCAHDLMPPQGCGSTAINEGLPCSTGICHGGVCS